MTTEGIILIGRGATGTRNVLETQAARLDRRGIVDDVHVATYETEPIRELRDQLSSVEADRVYAVPMCAAHTHDTTSDVPAALSFVDGAVHYCEPVGRSPAVTDVLARTASELVPPGGDASLVLVGFGSSSQPYQRQTAEYHAARLREGSTYGEVLTCYLLQNPAVECVRYDVSNERAVATPLFLAPSEATEAEIPAKLELDRGGIEYADPFGEDERIADAIVGEVGKQRALGTSGEPARETFEARLTRNCHPVATDGEGVPR